MRATASTDVKAKAETHIVRMQAAMSVGTPKISVRNPATEPARWKYAVARSGADDDQRHDAENDFNAHGAVAHKTHVLFVGNHL